MSRSGRLQPRRRSSQPAWRPLGVSAPAPAVSRASPGAASPPFGPSLPFSNRRHGRQDAVDIPAGLQSEMGAAVIQQVELDIATAPLALLVALLLGPGLRHAAGDDLGLDVQKRLAHRLGEGE